jgi:CubicO group peptidase (beta-lactamase class C family)
MKKHFRFSLFFLFLLGISTNLILSQKNNHLSELRNYITFKLQRDHIPGLAVCIVGPDGIKWSQGFGFQNLETHIPMTPQSVMGTASVSKLVTAIAIMQLVEHHKLQLDDPINKFLPMKIWHPKYQDINITIEQLLSHTASTSNGPSLWRCFSCDKQSLTKEQWVRAYFLPGGKYYHPEGNFGESSPGKKFLYSNAGYSLLAYIVEVVSGLPFNQYCRNNIFSPLNMANTSFDDADVQQETLSNMYSYGYNMDLERDLMKQNADFGKAVAGDYFLQLCNYTTSTVGATGMYSSVEQLAQLLIALMNGGIYNGKIILNKSSVAKILSHYLDAHLLPGQFAEFGLGGYAMRLYNSALVWGHTGADPGQSSFLLFNPETRVGAIVLTNRFVDIRDLIEWVFAEGIGQFSSTLLDQLGDTWREYMNNRVQWKVTVRIFPTYLPGGSQLFVIGNHRYLGGWVNAGIPLFPQKDRKWERTFLFSDSTKLEFKITRGSMDRQAVSMDGKIPPNNTLVVVKDTVLPIVVEDWKDQAQP